MTFLLTNVSALIGQGIISADPTAEIAASWILSALILGGLVAHALFIERKSR